MANSQLLPLQSNPQTGEPFLRLRSNPNIILTPLRWNDSPELIALRNDPGVHIWLGTPYPYLQGESLSNTRCATDG